MADEAELVLDAKAELGEGALWDSKQSRLLWIDILEGTVHTYDPASGRDEHVPVGQMVGTVVPRAAGGLMLAVQHGFAAFDPRTNDLQILCDPESHLPHTRFNDGKCDPAGRFWAGTMPLGKDEGKPLGSLYRLDADHSVHKMFDGVGCSNGIVWTADRSTMYYVDTFTSRIDAFDYDPTTGDITNRRTAIRTSRAQGYPDGMTIDAEGNLWVAFWSGHCVRCLDPGSGTVLHTIEVPALQVTSCAFGGPDLEDLFITTARTGLDPDALGRQPQAGGLFCARPGARGVAAFEYAG